jgi:Ran GTPase-activating protein (RanGAP) involved in mRNA processing and transport
LNCNSIRCDGLQYLASALFVNDTLRFLCLSDNEVCGVDDAGEGDYDPSGLASLTRVMKENKTLRTLKIAENELRDYGAGLLGDLFDVGCELRAIDISSNSLFGDAEKALSGNVHVPRRRVPVIVTEDTALSQENTSTNHNTTSESPGAISPRVRAAARLCSSGVGEGGKKFLSSLGENCKLTHIDLSFNDMGPRCASMMSESLRLNRSLLCLELRGNSIKCDGLIAIADFLAGPNSIRVLGIERCGIAARGVRRFAEVLAMNEPLRKLNMSLNDIGDEGASHLSKALKINNRLSYLYLHRCNLGSEGVAYVSSMLQINSSIRHLGLSCNNMGDTGLMALSATILLNRSLVSLDISETKLRRRQAKVSKIGPVAWAALAGMIKENARLKVLNISGYSIPPESLDVILEAMNSRRICLVKADFGPMRWKYDACVEAISAERHLLADTGMAPVIRVNVCGEPSIGKTTALKGWIRIADSSVVTPMFTGIFGLGIFMQPVRASLNTVDLVDGVTSLFYSLAFAGRRTPPDDIR